MYAITLAGQSIITAKFKQQKVMKMCESFDRNAIVAYIEKNFDLPYAAVRLIINAIAFIFEEFNLEERVAFMEGAFDTIGFTKRELECFANGSVPSSNWFLTDDSSNQHVRIVSEDRGQFDIIDTVLNAGEVYTVVCGTVSVNVEDLHDPDFVQDYLRPFGYTGYEHLVELYGDGAFQIAAECAFESNPYRYGDTLFTGDEDECLSFIADFVQKEGCD